MSRTLASYVLALEEFAKELPLIPESQQKFAPDSLTWRELESDTHRAGQSTTDQSARPRPPQSWQNGRSLWCWSEGGGKVREDFKVSQNRVRPNREVACRSASFTTAAAGRQIA